MSVGAPTFLSVFSGVGGFDLGLERSGWRCAGQIEVDPFCTRVLARHWPNVPRWGDVRTVRANQSARGARLSPAVISTSTDEELHSAAGGLSGPIDVPRWGDVRGVSVDTSGCASEPCPRFACADAERQISGSSAAGVDLLCGGFPCQDLSTAGRRAGLSAARSGLFFEFVRLAGELRPRWLLLENVPGLFSSNGGRDFALILHTLDELGYGVSWRVLDSRYFGVPQRRRRVFLIGHLGAACPFEVLFESEGGERDSAPSGEAGESVTRCLAASAGGTGDGQGDDWNTTYALTARQTSLAGEDTFVYGFRQSASVMDNGRPQANLSPALRAGDTTGSAVAFAWQQGTAAEKDRAYIVRAGDYAGAVSTTRQDAVAYAINDKPQPHVSVGLTAPLDRNGGSSGATQSGALGSAVRRLTATECELLQSFPPGWTCLCDVQPYSTANCRCPDSPRYAALGNAVTVNVITWLGQRLIAAHIERTA
jgi:DNA (cytosine-5)-methyltransferase 1